MKLCIFKICYLFLASGATLVKANPILRNSVGHGIFRRQHFHNLEESVIKKATVASVKTLTPKLNEKAVRKQVRYGPYLVPGSNENTVTEVGDQHDMKGAAGFQERLEPICDECMVLYGVAIPEYENGTALSAVGGSIYNHHITTVNRGRAERHAMCPGSSILPPKQPGMFIAGGTDKEVEMFTNLDGTSKTGYYTTSKDKIDVFAEFMNYQPKAQDVYLVIEYEYLPGKLTDYLNTQNIFLSAGDRDCGDTFTRALDKKYSVTSKEWFSPADGYILNVRGHQHDGGSGVDFWINDKYICSSIPTYQKAENRGPTELEHQTISETSLCQVGQTLKKGDRIKFVANFDLEKYPQRQSNTGHLEATVSGVQISAAFPIGYELP